MADKPAPGTIAILPDDKTPWLTIRQFQIKYGVAENTVRTYIEKKLVTAILFDRNKGGAYRIKDPEWVAGGPLEILDHNFTIEDVVMFRPCEVSELLGVSQKCIRYMTKRGKLKYYMLGKSALTRRYPLSSVRAMVAMRAAGNDKRPSRTAVRKAMVDLARARLQAAL